MCCEPQPRSGGGGGDEGEGSSGRQVGAAVRGMLEQVVVRALRLQSNVARAPRPSRRGRYDDVLDDSPAGRFELTASLAGER